ncbi:MAG: hypothetical protein RJB26_1894 [Pseudomonadota bacterium]
MRSLLWLFLDILLRRRGPQDVPASPALGWAVVCAAFGASAAYSAFAVPDGRWLARTAADLVASALFLAGLLLASRRLSRFQQSFTAMNGASLLLSIPALGLLAVAQTGWAPLQLPLTLAFYMLIVASLFVTEHILRETLECPRLLSIPLTVANLFLSLAVAQWFDQSTRAA